MADDLSWAPAWLRKHVDLVTCPGCKGSGDRRPSIDIEYWDMLTKDAARLERKMFGCRWCAGTGTINAADEDTVRADIAASKLIRSANRADLD